MQVSSPSHFLPGPYCCLLYIWEDGLIMSPYIKPLLSKQDNEVLHDIFGFSPKRKLLSGTQKLSGTEKVSTYYVA